MDISLHQLKVFTAVARLSSFTRAGVELGLTQSAISRSIRELESEIGLKLFDRTTRHVQLTEAGDKLSGRIGLLLQEVEAALRGHDGVCGAPRGNVCIASSALPAATLLPACWVRCREAYPEIDITLRETGQDAALDAVLHGYADFAMIVAASEDCAHLPELHCEALACEPLCVVVPREHALAARHTVEWRELEDAMLLVLERDAGGEPDVRHALPMLGNRGQSIQAFSHPATIVQLAQRGLGFGVMPLGALSSLDDGRMTARPLRPEIRQTVLLARRKNRSLRSGASAIWSELTAMAGDYRARHPMSAVAA